LACAGIAGCGSAESEPPAGGAGATTATVPASGPSAPVGGGASLVAEAPTDAAPPSAAPASAAAAPQPKIPTPTAEQIAKWTPAPHEPLALLAIREWDEKASFSARLAPVDGKRFVVVGSRVLLWSLEGDDPEHVFLDLTAEDGDRDILSLAVAPDGSWFAAGDSNGILRTWSLKDRSEIATKDLESNGVVGLAISTDGVEIATIAYEGVVNTWNAADLAPRNKFDVDTNSVKEIAYATPNQVVAAGETTSLWDTSSGKLVLQLSPGRYATALARSADGKLLAFGSDDALHIWNVADAKDETVISHGLSGRELVAFSPDGKLLATSDGRSVTLWNLAERRVVQALDGFGWAVVGVAWLPETNLLAVASESGVTRIWGTPTAGAAVGVKPLHTPVPPPNAAAKTPATPAQIEEMFDARLLPQLPGSEPRIVDPQDYSALVPASVVETHAFYRHFLTQAGWKDAPVPSTNPATMEYRKDGFMLSLSCYDSGDGKTDVSLHHEGNYDMRWIPRFDAAPTEPNYESEYVLSYTTKADLLTIETALRRQLHKAGWAGYTRLHSSHSEEADARDIEFVKNGTTLRVSFGKFPATPDRYTIQASLFPNEGGLPVPADAGFIEYDGSHTSSLVAITKLSLDESRKFYADELTAWGWLVRENRASDKGDRAWVSVIRGQRDMTVGFTKLPDGRTLVQAGDTGGSLWEAAQATAKAEAEGDGSEKPPAAGLEAADFPALNAEKKAEYDEVGKTIAVRMQETTLSAAAARYIEALAALGWKDEAGGIRAEDYTMITFAQGEEEFTLRARLDDGVAAVSFEGDGLLWTKPLPGGKQLVSYERWLLLGNHPPTLDLLDEYEAEMRAIQAK
jgi:hypothetical protein